jgi:hypothetical protein
MALTLAIAPQKLSFSENTNLVQILCDDYIDQPGVEAVSKLVFFAAVAAGHQTRLTWAKGDITLTAAAIPDGSGNQYIAGPGDVAHVQAVLSELQNNPYFDHDFDLTFQDTMAGPSIVFTAKEAGELFNLTPVGDATVAVVTVVTGLDEALKPNIEIQLQIWLKFGAGFKNISTNNLILDLPVTGVASKDLSEILHPYLVPGFYNNDGSDKPVLNSVAWQACGNTLLEYYLKYAEVYGATPQIKKLSKSDHCFVNIGGLDTDAALNQTLAGYLRPGGSNNSALCLRQGSKTKMVQHDQPEFLYWINLTGADIAIRLRIDIHYTDGDTSGFTVSPVNALAWSKYYIAVGYNARNLELQLRPGKSCAYYTARVVDEAGLFLTGIYTYVIDTYCEWPRYFIYRNSLGGFQTVFTYGKAQPETDFTSDKVKKQVTREKTAVIGNQVDDNTRLQTKNTVNTGYISQRDVANLKDFFISEEKFLVSGTRLIPISIASDSLKEGLDGDNMNAAQFVYTKKYDDNLYTDDITYPDNPIAGGGSQGGQRGFNVVRDDGKNNDNVFYDKDIL